jgi:tetratricopeptide (TPR) repeat protein
MSSSEIKKKIKGIEEAIKKGKVKKAKKEIAALSFKKNLKSEDKIKLAFLMNWTGDLSKTISLLGPMMSLRQLNMAKPEQLWEQIYLARMYNFAGARYTATHHLTSIESVIDAKFPDFSKQYPLYFKVIADMNHLNDRYEESLLFINKFLALSPKEDTDYLSALLNKSSCLNELGQTEESIDLINKVISEKLEDSPTLLGVFYQSLAEYHFYNNDLDKAQELNHLSDQNLKIMQNTKEYAYSLRLKGMISVMRGDYKEAEKSLFEALNILLNSKVHPYPIIKTSYWINQIPNSHLPFDINIMLYTHETITPYSFLSGRNIDLFSFNLNSWYSKRYTVNQDDCWSISNQNIKSSQYNEIMKEYKDSSLEIIDLISGVMKSTSGEIQILSDIEKKILSLLFSSGRIGCHQYRLSDYVYRLTFSNPTDGLNRIKDRINSLKKKNFSITQKKNYYYLNLDYELFSQNKIIILPMLQDKLDLVHFMAGQKEKFTRQDVTSILQTSPSTAKRYLKKWVDEDKVTVVKSGKTVSYILK